MQHVHLSLTVTTYAKACLAYEPGKILTAIDEINSDLRNVSKWSVSNGLKLNASKCTVLHVGPHVLTQTLDGRSSMYNLNHGIVYLIYHVRAQGVLLMNDFFIFVVKLL